MAITWPTTFPAPLRAGLSIAPNPEAKARMVQSGRKEIRRWGKGKGDTITCTLRLTKAQEIDFKRFWEWDLNSGLNWIDAGWLNTGLGYVGKCCRIVGYSPRKYVGNYIDYTLNFDVRSAANCWDDTHWLSASGHVAPVDESWVDGAVINFKNSYGTLDVITNMPSGLRAVKVLIGAGATSSFNGRYPVAVALKLDGSLVAWGYAASVTAFFPGIANLANIRDIAISYGGLYYLTDTGYIGHIGAPGAGTGYPIDGGYKAIWAGTYIACALNKDNTLVFWRANTVYSIPTDTITNPRSVHVSKAHWMSSNSLIYSRLAIVGPTGKLYSPGGNGGTVVWSKSDVDFIAADAAMGGSGAAIEPAWVGYGSDGVWRASTVWATLATYLNNKPSGLVPKQLLIGTYNYNAVAVFAGIHTDDTLYLWGNPTYAPTITAGQKVRQVEIGGTDNNSLVYGFAILKE